MDAKVIKLASAVLSVASAGVTLAAGFIEDKKLKMEVAEEVAKALKNINK